MPQTQMKQKKEKSKTKSSPAGLYPAGDAPVRGKPNVSSIIDRNIRMMIRQRAKAARKRGTQDKIADVITSFSGNMIFVYVHIIWFTIWIALNTGNFGIQPFDPYPYGLLTMIVSLEAIFLSTFVLISQNRTSQEVDQRADLDMHIDMLAEHEMTRALQMLDAIQRKLGIETSGDEELADMEKVVNPEDVLAEIDRLQEKIK